MRINMPIEPLIGFLIIGLVAGFLAEQIIRGKRNWAGYQSDCRSRRGLHRGLSVQLHEVVLSRTHRTIDQCDARGGGTPVPARISRDYALSPEIRLARVEELVQVSWTPLEMKFLNMNQNKRSFCEAIVPWRKT